MNKSHGTDAGAELDLHELTVDEAIEELIRFYNGRIGRGEKGRIDVIHGNVHGDRIKRRLHAFLARHADRVAFEPGENVDGNAGKTLVYPERALPDRLDLLEGEILEFCRTPKTREKIAGEFRRHGHGKVAQAISNLTKSGQLVKLKDAHTRYQTKV